MDAEALRRELMGLKPCVVFHDIVPDTLAKIRAAAQPQPPAQIEFHQHYLDRVDLDALEASHTVRQQMQDFLDDATRAHVLAEMATYERTLREVWRVGDL